MQKAIGMIEFKTVSAGITAADQMVKTSDVEILEAQTVCPGKYVAIIAGDLSAVRAAVERARATRPEELIDDFVLGNPDPSIFPAIYGTSQVEDVSALYVYLFTTRPPLLWRRLSRRRTAIVQLIELRIAKGMCGKSYLLITGEVAACEAAIAAATESVGEKGMFLDSSVIAHPDAQICKTIL